tara:strand:- start:5475 stop:5900 length:426 start_codon:yes stop_codon:yes gene_type:complete
MFVEFDETKYPVVRVNFSGVIRNENDFNEFTNKWIELYSRKSKFTFIFDTRNMGMMGPKYCFKMATFIKNLKKRPVQYLEKSIIIVSNRYIRLLLWLIFSIQKPVAPVYITDIHQEIFINMLNDNIQQGLNIPDCIQIVKP